SENRQDEGELDRRHSLVPRDAVPDDSHACLLEREVALGTRIEPRSRQASSGARRRPALPRRSDEAARDRSITLPWPPLTTLPWPPLPTLPWPPLPTLPWPPLPTLPWPPLPTLPWPPLPTLPWPPLPTLPWPPLPTLPWPPLPTLPWPPLPTLPWP